MAVEQTMRKSLELAEQFGESGKQVEVFCRLVVLTVDSLYLFCQGFSQQGGEFLHTLAPQEVQRRTPFLGPHVHYFLNRVNLTFLVLYSPK